MFTFKYVDTQKLQNKILCCLLLNNCVIGKCLIKRTLTTVSTTASRENCIEHKLQQVLLHPQFVFRQLLILFVE